MRFQQRVGPFVWRARSAQESLFFKHLGSPLGSPYNHNHDPAGWLPPPCLSPKGGLRGREAIVFFTAAVVITVAVVRGRPTVQSRGCAVIIKRVYQSSSTPSSCDRQAKPTLTCCDSARPQALQCIIPRRFAVKKTLLFVKFPLIKTPLFVKFP